MTDILNKEDIQIFVNAFYEKVRVDDLLAPIFDSKITAEQWPAHLLNMYDFWEMILFGSDAYKGQPFDKHVALPAYSEHYERWKELFHKTIDENFEGKKAEEAKSRGASMATLFNYRAEELRNAGKNSSLPITK